jgi:ArsR family transcriptional regulator, arsenate/arsenite/antimonite-responsive transcriptional repressor
MGGAMAKRSVSALVQDIECCPGVLVSPLDDDQAAVLAQRYAALGDPARVKIVAILADAEGGEVCVCDFVEPLGKTQGTVSHHLKVLSDAGLVVGDRRGKWVWYSIRPEHRSSLRRAIRP